MKKKYRIDFHKAGTLTPMVVLMVANHNDGAGSFNLIDLVGFINSMKCSNPHSNHGFTHQWNTQSPQGTSLLISEDGGETYTMTITKIDVTELNNAVDLAEKFNS